MGPPVLNPYKPAYNFVIVQDPLTYEHNHIGVARPALCVPAQDK